MTLEQELIDIFASASYPRNREILIGYYGWQDGHSHTLTEIGARFGITRERVRQVCAKLTKRPNDAQLPAPKMDQALALIQRRLPAAACDIEAELQQRGLTDVGLSIESIIAGAKLLRRPIVFKTVTLTGGACDKDLDSRLVILPDQSAAVMAIVDLAKKDIYFHGLGTIDAIHRAAQSRCGEAASVELVRQTLLLMEGFHWLDEATGWFRLLPVHRHGLPKAIEKVLSVAGSVTAAQLHDALGRNRRLWKEPPPGHVLLAFCRQMPNVRVEGNRIFGDPPRDWSAALTGVEAQLVAILKEHGPVMERGAMEDLCVAGGMNRFSFHAFVSWSPVITQLGHSVYGLLGAEVSSKQVKALLSERRANRGNHRVLDQYGWTDDGKVWLRYRLSKAASTYAVITVPAALKQVVRGRFQFLDREGQAVGTLATKDGRAWGLGAFLRKQGAQIGDRIVLTLDLEKRTAAVTWDTRENDSPCNSDGEQLASRIAENAAMPY